MALELLPNPGGLSIEDMLEKLEISANSKDKRGRARRNEYQTWDDPNVKVTGWKFNEWDYSSKNVTLPVPARGLFTYDNRIAVRGYNKFFNIDEVASTKWDSIEKKTEAPYYLTSKENGCIIFMAGLDDGTLLITSKNSTGPIAAVTQEKSHSWVAAKWVDKHLASQGLTRKDLALELRRLNATAVGELCDDSFEEHVLAYSGDRAGIYLHGINLNTPKFATYSCIDVENFAHKYGFYSTPYTVANSLDELKSFLKSCESTGQWNGIDVEGFVIRCQADLEDGSVGDFFFKYKFKEPYLMYRNWREVTRQYLGGKKREDIKIHANKVATDQYLDFAIQKLEEDPVLRAEYSENHGIIKLREMFLSHVGKQGIDLAHLGEESSSVPVKADESVPKIALVPVSTIGCGKTTLFAALRNLFGWGHIQNDELQVSSKQKKSVLVQGAVRLLQDKPVVMVDRNNHQFRERAQLIEDMDLLRVNVHYVCLNFWSEDKVSKDQLWKVTRDRVEKRGDNHATIKLSKNGGREVDMIMRGFLSRFQPVATDHNPDALFDQVIDLDVTKGTRYNLQAVIEALHQEYPEIVDRVPSEKEIDAAFESALRYTPAAYQPPSDILKPIPRIKAENKVKVVKPVYFNVEIFNPAEIVEAIEKFFMSNPSINRSFWDRLKAENRVSTEMHVTISYKGGKTERDEAVFKKLEEKYGSNLSWAKKQKNVPLGKRCSVQIKSLGFDHRILALGVAIVSNDEDIVNGPSHPHITIGYADGVRPVESNDMLKTSKSIYPWNIEPALIADQEFCAFMN